MLFFLYMRRLRRSKALLQKSYVDRNKKLGHNNKTSHDRAIQIRQRIRLVRNPAINAKMKFQNKAHATEI